MPKRKIISEGEPAEGLEAEDRTSHNATFTFRLPREELASIEQAATEAGISVAEYVRKSVAMRPAISVLAKPQYNLAIGTPFFQGGTAITWNETQTSEPQPRPAISGPAIYTQA